MNLKDEEIDNQIDILTNDWKKINQIYNSKLIISSSLHGIILAVAYGIPAILLNKTEGGICLNIGTITIVQEEKIFQFV